MSIHVQPERDKDHLISKRTKPLHNENRVSSPLVNSVEVLDEWERRGYETIDVPRQVPTPFSIRISCIQTSNFENQSRSSALKRKLLTNHSTWSDDRILEHMPSRTTHQFPHFAFSRRQRCGFNLWSLYYAQPHVIVRWRGNVECGIVGRVGEVEGGDDGGQDRRDSFESRVDGGKEIDSIIDRCGRVFR